MTDKIICKTYNSLTQDCPSKLDNSLATQIIIDGVNVSGCEFYCKKDIYHYSYEEYDICVGCKGDCLCTADKMCKDRPKCFYKKVCKKLERIKKQLQREKQNSQDTYEMYQALMESFNIAQEELTKEKSRKEKYKQALEEIKEIATTNDINTCWTVLTNCEQCSDKKECGIQSPLTKLEIILQKYEVLENE